MDSQQKNNMQIIKEEWLVSAHLLTDLKELMIFRNVHQQRDKAIKEAELLVSTGNFTMVRVIQETTRMEMEMEKVWSSY